MVDHRLAFVIWLGLFCSAAAIFASMLAMDTLYPVLGPRH